MQRTILAQLGILHEEDYSEFKCIAPCLPWSASILRIPCVILSALHTWWSPINICVTPISLQINTFCCRGTACCARLPVPCTWIRNAPLSEVIHTKHFTSARHLFENQTDRCNAPRKVHRTKIVMGMDRFFGHAVRDYTNRKPYQIQCRITTQQSVLIPIRTTTPIPRIPHIASPSIVNEIQFLHSG